MANTVMTAKNTFAEGLVMDFAPDNTQATTLTSALNATLLTFNGNEMSLQNDMGNGRVETAYLPEGYVPVGTCEFGDIIYIVSYNPITNKSQIGCFPSPERNISSEEIGGLKNSLKTTDFQEIVDSEPTGRLVASSCKKVLYQKELNPGDKYVVSSSDIRSDSKTFSDYGNTSHIYGKFPKLLKVHVVAIEDSGKINYLDSTVRWYDNFFIAPQKKDQQIPDLDSYRSLTSSGYSIFQSKVSGKLALLIELEKINSFSCTYDIYANTLEEDPVVVNDSNVQGKKYDVYWSINWDAEDDNINPKYLVLTKSEWSGKNIEDAGKWFPYTQDQQNKNNYSINYNEGRHINEFWDSALQPVAFYSIDGSVQPNYWYTTIDRLYKPEEFVGTFQDFIQSGSYQAKEAEAIETLRTSQTVYHDQVLSKLTVSRDQSGRPVNKYYINAHHLDNGKYYTAVTSGTYKEIQEVSVSDDMVNNYFSSQIYKHFTSFFIPFSQTFTNESGESVVFHPDISNLIYHYNITPAMPYGLLEEYTQDGYIDFSKVGTGEIKLTSWRYYNAENISTLTLGLDVYPESNKGVAEIAIDFIDNQGVAATYRIMNKNSYSGQFTEYIPLNGEASSYKLSDIDSEGRTIYHAGLKSTLDEENLVYKLGNQSFQVIKKNNNYFYINSNNEEVAISDTSQIYQNDAGTLYSNIVYLTKITVKYCSVDALNNFNTDNTSNFKYFYRWFWTNTLFNEYYYSTVDFDSLQATLDLDLGVHYSSNDRWKKITEKYEPDTLKIENEQIENLSANVQAINQDGSADYLGNVNAKVTVGLQNTYNTFSIAERVGNINYLDQFQLKLALGKSYIENTPESPNVESVNSPENEFEESINPTFDMYPDIRYDTRDDYGTLKGSEVSDTLLKLLGTSIKGYGKELWEGNYTNYKNKYSLNLATSLEANTVANALQYLGKDGEVIELNNCITYLSDLSHADIPLTFTGVHFSKYYKECISQSRLLQTLVPLVNTIDDLSKFGMRLVGGNAVFDTMITVAGGWNGKTAFDGADTKIHVGKYISDESSGNFSGAPTSFNKTRTYDSRGNFAITKNSSGSHKMWSDQVGGVWIRDLLSSDIGLVLYCSGDATSGNIYFVWDSDLHSYPSPRWEYQNRFGKLNEKTTPKFDNLVASGDQQYILGLVMKDTDGEIHLLNNLCPMYSSNGTMTQKVILNNVSEGSKYVGNIILSILSNIYVKMPEPQYIDIQSVSNIVSLEDNQSIFLKDVIYQVEAVSRNHNDLILMQGMQLSDYIKSIKEYTTEDINNSNVEFIIQSVQKNVPIQFAFNYIQPSKIISDLQSSLMAIRLGENDYYTTIPEINDTSRLYTVDRFQKNLVVKSATTVNGFGVTSVINSKESGRLVYGYSKEIMHYNPKFYSIFTYQDEHLRLSKTSYNSSEMLAYYCGRYENTIGGIVKAEYLTDYLKYVD